MSSIVITDRIKTVMKRWVTVHYPKCHTFLGQLKNNRDSEEFNEHHEENNMVYLDIGKIKIEFFLVGAWDEDEEEIEWEKIDVGFKISFNGTTFARDLKGKRMIDLFKIIDDLKEFKLCSICKCYEVEKDDVCIHCYPWITTQEDDCCICLENTPSTWCKLGCDHILHYHCFKKQGNKKCPLCRVENESYIPDRI
jgi:hypothetical protein